jgi:NTE family protein
MDTRLRPKVGLALGGGVARGIAHVGVLAVLAEQGIPVDFVAGTSAGSIVGAFFAAGLSIEKISNLVKSIGWRRCAGLVWSKEGFVSLAKLEAWLVETLEDVKFEDLIKPYCVTATDMETGMPVRFTQGRLAPAVHASCCVPGFIRPVRMDGRILGDGSLVDTVPVDILRKMGAEYVIGVDVFASAIRPRWGAPGMGFTAIEILVQRAGGGTLSADCLITPRLAGISYINFSNKDKLVALGRAAAEEKIPEIKLALGC